MNATPRGMRVSDFTGRDSEPGRRKDNISRRTRKCEACDTEFQPTGNRQWFCTSCGKGRRPESKPAPANDRSKAGEAASREAHNLESRVRLPALLPVPLPGGGKLELPLTGQLLIELLRAAAERIEDLEGEVSGG